jgi:hypothetical protein
MEFIIKKSKKFKAYYERKYQQHFGSNPLPEEISSSPSPSRLSLFNRRISASPPRISSSSQDNITIGRSDNSSSDMSGTQSSEETSPRMRGGGSMFFNF